MARNTRACTAVVDEEILCSTQNGMELGESGCTAETVVPVIDLSSDATGTVRAGRDNGEEEIDDLLEEQILLHKIRAVEEVRQAISEGRGFRGFEAVGTVERCGRRLRGPSAAEDDDLFDLLLDGSAAVRRRADAADAIRARMARTAKAMKCNLLMQAMLVKLDSDLAAAANENHESQAQWRRESGESRNAESSKSLGAAKETATRWYHKFGMPYFKVKDGTSHPCPPNKDYEKRLANKELISLNLKGSRMWTNKDKYDLENGVAKDIIDEKLAVLIVKERELKCELSRSVSNRHRGGEDLEENGGPLQKKLRNVRENIFRVKKMKLDDLLEECAPDREFDWMKISVNEFGAYHSAEECQRMWHLYVKPSIFKSKWSKEEDNRLLALVKRHNQQDWARIAEKLNTQRSGYQCFVHYQTRLNKDLKRNGKWTEAENNKLKKIVGKCRIGEHIPWSKVAYYFQGRSTTQVANHWKGSLAPDLKKGRFSKYEDRLMIACAQRFGNKFNKMANAFGNRTSNQIRERFSRTQPAKYHHMGRWTLDEDRLLMRLVKEHGIASWSEIGRAFGTRNRTQVRQRYAAVKSFLDKYPQLTIENMARSSKVSKRQQQQPTAIQSPGRKGKCAAAAPQTADRAIQELIKEKQFQEMLARKEISLASLRRGRKKQFQRMGVDAKLIEYFQESYSYKTLNRKRCYAKPDVGSAAKALHAVCSFFKTDFTFAGDSGRVKALSPYTLRYAVAKLIEDNGGSLYTFDGDCGPDGEAPSCSSLSSATVADIDCSPVNADETFINESELLINLAKLRELEGMQANGQNKAYAERPRPHRLSEASKYRLPYLLPPNIVTMMGLRSILLIEPKLVKCLKDCSRSYSIDPELLSVNGKLIRFFSDDEEEEEEDDEDDDDDDDDDEKSDEDFVLESEGSKKLALRSSDERNLPSGSRADDENALAEGRGCSGAGQNRAEPAASELSGETRTDDAGTCRRLTKEDAVSLWQERLMALFGFPIVLAQHDVDSKSVGGLRSTTRRRRRPFFLVGEGVEANKGEGEAQEWSERLEGRPGRDEAALDLPCLSEIEDNSVLNDVPTTSSSLDSSAKFSRESSNTKRKAGGGGDGGLGATGTIRRSGRMRPQRT